MICPRCKREIPDDSVLCCYCARVFKRTAKARTRPVGSGTVYKRGDVWEAQVTVGWSVDASGKRHRYKRTKGGFKTKAEAMECCSQLIREQTESRKALPLAAYWEIYSGGKMEKLSDEKRESYKIAWAKMKSIANRRIDQITVSDLQELVRAKTSTYYPARDMKVVLTHLFRIAAADGVANQDTPSFIELPSKEEKERQPFTPNEQIALWRAWESGCTDAAIPLIMIYTGMMTGEARRLTVEMIDFDAREIRGVGMKTKVRKNAAVILPVDIVPVLSEICAGRTGRVWTCNEDTFYERYYAALDVAGVRRLTPYSCRHTTATALAINNNIAPETVRKLMRWSTTAMLSKYAHPDTTDLLAAADTIGKNRHAGASETETPAT